MRLMKKAIKKMTKRTVRGFRTYPGLRKRTRRCYLSTGYLAAAASTTSPISVVAAALSPTTGHAPSCQECTEELLY
jgi:hypothetical protein